MHLISKNVLSLYFILLCAMYILAFIIGCLLGDEDYFLLKEFYWGFEITELKLSSSFEIFVKILMNNMAVSLSFFLLGFISIGIFPILLSFYNGFIFGNVTGCCLHILDIDIILLSTLPHIFEFVGLNLFGLTGFYMSYKYLFCHSNPNINYIFSIVIIATSIIVIAALTESYISI